METTGVYPTTLDEWVFAGRNQLYGAYVLRRTYRRNAQKATLLGIVLTTVGLTVPTLYARFAPAEPEQHVALYMTNVAIPPATKPEVELPKPPPKSEPLVRPSTKFLPLEIQPDEKVEEVELPPTQDQLAQAPAGQETVLGSPDAIIEIAEATETAPPAVVTVEPAPEDPLLIVEQQPEFPGGLAAFNKFLRSHLRYPTQAAKAGISGKVFLSFVVGTDGRITQLEVSKGLGFGCDEESIRVAKLMPNWKPGRQSGRAVPVRFTLPIYFQLE